MRKILFIVFILGMAWKLLAQEELPLRSPAPGFSAIDQYGKTIRLKDLRNKGPVILFFYRGEWCPNCTRQMSNVQDSLPLITRQGASVVAIGPERSEHVKETTILFIFVGFSLISLTGYGQSPQYQKDSMVTKKIDEAQTVEN